MLKSKKGVRRLDYRKWYDKDIKTSLLGFGAMRLKTIDGEIDEQKALKLFDYAYHNGVNYFDTAMPYTDGKNEAFVGKALKRYPRNSFYLATKLTLRLFESRKEVEELIDKQLETLQTEYIDMYLLHAMNKERLQKVKEWEIIPLLEKWKAAGKIRYIGFSFHDDYDAFKELLDLYDWDFAQIQLNYLDTEIQQGIQGYYDLEERRIPVVIMEPIKGGKLAKFNGEIEKIFKDHSDASIASWALRWVGSLPGVKVILSGMNELEQVIDNVNTFKEFKPLSKEEFEIIANVKNVLQDFKAVGCTNCKYCLPCTVNIDIPAYFSLYNNHRMFANEELTRHEAKHVKEKSALFTECIECGQCVEACPQGIDIPNELKKLGEMMEILKW
jgi:predicted aldo/keto reductase-like oxidoreductase